QPLITFMNVLWCELLRKIGLKPDAVGGHSLGEFSALYAAQSLDFEAVMHLTSVRGRHMADLSDPEGSMIHIACNREDAESLLGKTGAQIANVNAANQTIIAGTRSALEKVLDQGRRRGLRGAFLPVSGAFHSSLM